MDQKKPNKRNKISYSEESEDKKNIEKELQK
jgi:hypothetical protein